LVTIYKTPTISTTLQAVQYSGLNPTDGLSLFNLELANDAICLGNEDYEVFYYHSFDAENDLNNTESIGIEMRSRMKSYMQKKTKANATCYSMGSITLHANENHYYEAMPVI
jgi:hypothetical protein